MIKLSIIIPVYNAATFIGECLSSILPELKKDMEIILLDDGSTDQSLDIISKFESYNIHVLHHENRGVSYTRNRGIDYAKGKYVLFVDADDLLMPGWSDLVINNCNDYYDVVYFSSNYNAESFNKRVIVDSIFGIRRGRLFKGIASPTSKLFLKNSLKKNNIYFHEDLINGEDAIFNLEVIIKADNYNIIGKSFYRYRIYDSSSTKRYNHRFIESNIAFLQYSETILRKCSLNFSNIDIDRYISFSFINSIYIWVFLLTKIQDKDYQKKEFGRIYNNTMSYYFNRYKNSSDCSFRINVIYYYVRSKKERSAIYIMNLIETLKNKRVTPIRWEII